ncbi:transposase [Vibrio alginolyticus]|uniref:transposase n=1 Tax=Vibrio alginolyticus TaxID=663 RepID=UPI001BD3B5C0|nr:transposase [Vibrio alginolyticus]MBS9899164.1 transposase [Vibrio alginolyticus]
MPNFKTDYSNQNMFIPVIIDEQLIPGTIEYAIAHIVDNHLDLSPFDAHYSNDQNGAAAYPPSIMLKVIFYAYSLGMLSSRRIERACINNVTFMCLSGDSRPHFTTIAAFIAQMKNTIEPLFTQVLMICDEQGLIGRNMFAIDGCKISSNASKEWSGTHDELRRKQEKLERASQRIIERHQSQDALPNEVIEQDLRQKQKLDNSANKIGAFLARTQDKLGSNKKPVKSNITDNDSAKMTTSKGTIQGYNGITITDDKHQIILHSQVWGSVGEQQTLKPTVLALKAQLDKLPNTAEHPTKFTADSGFHSKANLKFMAETPYDCYIADTGFRSRNPLFQNSETYQTEQAKKRKRRSKTGKTCYPISMFEFNQEAMTCRCPAGNMMRLSSKDAVIRGERGAQFCGYLNDCRQCIHQSQCMRKAPGKQVGRQVFFIYKNTQDFDHMQAMKDKIDSPEGRRQYSKRLGCVEPVFGNITVNKQMNRFTLRGKEKVNAQWAMFSMLHNIEKLRNHIK